MLKRWVMFLKRGFTEKEHRYMEASSITKLKTTLSKWKGFNDSKQGFTPNNIMLIY